jgi:hypothetical protein
MENTSTDEQKEIFVQKHKELSQLLGYPPFTINKKKRDDFKEQYGEESDRMHKNNEWDRPFSTLEMKWKDDLEEAELYMKRYNSPKKAQEEAMKINKIEPDDYNEDIEPIYS